MSYTVCPRCEQPMSSGRVQRNGQVWCFDCSMDPHDVRVRMQKMDGTFAAPKGPFRVELTRLTTDDRSER